MRLVRCDVCMREGPLESHMPDMGPTESGWTHVTILRSVDRREVVRRGVTRLVEKAKEAETSGEPSEMISFAGNMVLGGMPSPEPHTHACVEICPSCSERLVVSVGGTPIGDIERVIRPIKSEDA